MPDSKKAILLRISPELWDALNHWARDELRSVNAQIEFVLREAVRKRGRGRGEWQPEGSAPRDTKGTKGGAKG